jgi:hypothetical protein
MLKTKSHCGRHLRFFYQYLKFKLSTGSINEHCYNITIQPAWQVFNGSHFEFPISNQTMYDLLNIPVKLVSNCQSNLGREK